MSKMEKFTLEEAHLQFAKETNNKVWELLSDEKRSESANQEMLEAAYASSYHWRIVGTALNRQRAEWMLAHVFTILGKSEAALAHAQACQALTEAHRDLMSDFDLAYAAEGLARAYALAGNLEEAGRLKAEARRLGDQIQDAEDMKIFDGDLDGGDWYGLT
jgi:hypothetical protein